MEEMVKYMSKLDGTCRRIVCVGIDWGQEGKGKANQCKIPKA